MMKLNHSPTATTNHAQDFENDRKRLTSIDRLVGNFFDIVGLDDLSAEISEGGGKSKEFTTTNSTSTISEVKVFTPSPVREPPAIHLTMYQSTAPRRSKRPNGANNTIVIEPAVQQQQLHQQRIPVQRSNSSDHIIFPTNKKEPKFSIRHFMQRRKSHYGDIDSTTTTDNEVLNRSTDRKDDVCWYPAK